MLVQKVFPIEIPYHRSQKKLTTKDAKKKHRKPIPNCYQPRDIASATAKIATELQQSWR